MNPTLEEATLDQILEELSGRFSGVLIGVCGQSKGSPDNKVEGISFGWRGGSVQALGLAKAAEETLKPYIYMGFDGEEDDDELWS